MTANRNIEQDREMTLALLVDIANGAVVSTDVPNWLGHHGDGNSRIDSGLLWGSTLSWDGAPPRGGVDEHLRHLRVEHGLTVIEINGVHRIVVLPLEPEA